MTPNQILQKYWGFDKFRPLQKEIVNSVLQNHDTLALLPTGGGKSICFQIPALSLEGITLVISPLIALMKDQVEGLKGKGIQAEAIYSGMHYTQIDRILDNAVYGKLKMLYLSPERLQTKLFLERLIRMRVSLIAVDEAHCISQWGYDFRPSYLNIALLREKIGKDVPIIALTATATPPVVEDIQEKLLFKAPKVIQKSFDRKNLAYKVIFSENKQNELLRFIQKRKGSGIIYLRSRIKSKTIAELLNRNNIAADYYHAGLTQKERNDRQNAWIKDKSRIICATNAFGMGIDKSNVRFVIHFDLPDNIESYFQEAGRAGRDEQFAEAVSILFESDLISLRDRMLISFPPIGKVRDIYQAVCNQLQLAIGSGEDETFSIDLHDVASRVSSKLPEVYSALKIIEIGGYISLSESIKSPSEVLIKLQHQELLSFIENSPSTRPLLHLILRNYSEITGNHIKISEEFLAKSLNRSPLQVINQLKYLAQLEVIDYKERSNKPRITFVIPRLDPKSLHFAQEQYNGRKNRANQKMEAIIHYVKAVKGCRNQILLSYFGEQSTARCGHCDLCLQETAITLSSEFDQARRQVKQIVQKDAVSLQQLKKMVVKDNEAVLINVVQWLLDNKEIKIDKLERLCIN